MGMSIVIAAGVMGALGVICAVCLGVAVRVLAIAGDPRIDALEALFGSTNCGACGYASCRMAAQAVVNGEANVDICALGGPEVATQTAEIIGKEDEAASSSADAVNDTGRPQRQKRELPPPVPMVPGEIPVIDEDACIACGVCVHACTHGAIVGEPKTIPTINLDDCTLCGACVPACRKGFITVENQENES